MAGIGSVNFGGLASGLDTNQIIDQLVEIDSQPLRRLERQKTDLTKKKDTFSTMKSDLLELQAKAYELKSASTFGAFSASSSDDEALNVTASSTANEGNYSIKILSLSQTETLSGNSYTSTDTDLGVSGEMIINNQSIKVRTTDSLIDIRNGINALDAGVSASILKVTDTDNRLIISSGTAGAEGFRIANTGSTDIIGTLGFTDSTKSIRETDNGNVLSASFSSSQSTVGSLLDIASDASGTIGVRNKKLNIDLATDSLSTIRDKINELNINGVSAMVESVDTDNGNEYRLAISGTQEFEDGGNVLETLGILERGTSGTYAEFSLNRLTYTNGNGHDYDDDDMGKIVVAKESTKLSTLGANTGETIAISGSDAEGNVVSTNITLEKNDRVGDVLNAIETAFDNKVDAYLDDGTIMVKSMIAGSNSFSFSIDAGNELGGSLDFGTTATVTHGRDRQLVEGKDATLLINNVEVSRTENEISDVISGLSLTLKKADVDTEVNITVERDRSVVKDKVADFVDTYNEFVQFINENSKYDEDNNSAGPLLGDITARTVSTRLRESLRTSVFGDDAEYSQLIEVGIETTTEGKLKIDSAKLDDALTEDVDSVIALFTATRESSDNDVQFVYHSEKTTPGTYAVNITQAAESAEVSSVALNANGIGAAGTVTIADQYDSELSVAYTADMTAADFADAINEEASKSKNQMLRSDTALTTGVNDSPVTQNTLIADISGAQVATGDTISISATNHSGRSFQRIITFDDDLDVTMQDVLDAVESLNDYQAVASIDSSGNILLEDSETGTSDLALSITSTVQGLDFGNFGIQQKGRTDVGITAEVTGDNRLKIAHGEYGSNKSFSVSGLDGIGIADGEYSGLDVEGTINGVTAVGNGQTLTASADDENSRGVVLRVSLTASELLQEGSDQGSVTLVSGIADILYSELSSMTNSVDGFIQSKIDSLDLSLNSMGDRITNVGKRVDLKRQQYVRQFTELEKSMARLESMKQTLSAGLGALPSVRL